MFMFIFDFWKTIQLVRIWDPPVSMMSMIHHYPFHSFHACHVGGNISWGSAAIQRVPRVKVASLLRHNGCKVYREGITSQQLVLYVLCTCKQSVCRKDQKRQIWYMLYVPPPECRDLALVGWVCRKNASMHGHAWMHVWMCAWTEAEIYTHTYI